MLKINNLQEKNKYQREIKEFGKKRIEKRKNLFVAQDTIDAKKRNIVI